jgi:hypothetical protein
MAMSTLTDLVSLAWHASGDRLEVRCRDLSDAEFFWEPVPGAWTIIPDADRPGRWTYPYEFEPAPPAPVTTIGWRLVHLAADNWIYWEYAFGAGQRTFPDLDVPSTAHDALQDWHGSREPITQWLATATDADFAEPRPSHLGADRTAAEVLRILIDEQTHHGAEIALLRDLYLRLAVQP